jgi:hypothetical protein
LFQSDTRRGAGNGGQVLKFDPNTLQFKGVFIDDIGGIGGLNRPDGLVFGPNGNLYVTSFRLISNPIDPAAVDSIRAYDRFGRFLESILLYNRGEPRAFAQAILFGPDGKLFVPISGGGPSTGEIRQYDVRTKKYDIFVKGGILVSPQYLTKAFSVAGEKQEKRREKKFWFYCNGSRANPALKRRVRNSGEDKRLKSPFHHDFDGVDFTIR